MKKIFTAPAVEIIKLQNADIIATSSGIEGFSDSFIEGGVDDGYLLSRDGDWEWAE